MNNLDLLSEESKMILEASNKMDSMLLITGETGVGKTFLADAAHKSNSKRGMNKFSKINLACLSENIIESELFGHERGAFTGADTRRVGRLEISNGGTVFLDEIGELSLRLQTKLLDFIQHKKITPVGSNREIELDVRIIAATNKNLEEAVAKGEFRSDLFHRLNVFHIELEGIRNKNNSIKKLVKEFIANFSRQTKKEIFGLSQESESLILRYNWPGNIRELEHVIEYAVAVESSSFIQAKSLPKRLIDKSDPKVVTEEFDCDNNEGEIEELQESQDEVSLNKIQIELTNNFHECKENFEKQYLVEMLKLCRGQINKTGRFISLNKVSLMEKIKKYDIDWKKIREENFGPKLNRKLIA